MPAPKKVFLLPAELRKELDARLVRSGFAGHEGLAAWLKSQGYEISRGTVGRYALGFKRRLAAIRMATEQARAVVEASPDQDNTVNDALMRLVQERLFRMLVDLQEIDVADATPELLAKLARSIAELGRASVSQKRWAEQMRAQAERKLEMRAEAAKRKGGAHDLEVFERARELVRGVLP
jgi:hypothetical protein